MSDELCKSFGIAVRQLRERKKWSQEQLAAQSNLNRSYVGEIERGCVIASIVTAQKLARALDLGLAGLIAECEQLDTDRSPSHAPAGVAVPVLMTAPAATPAPDLQSRAG